MADFEPIHLVSKENVLERLIFLYVSIFFAGAFYFFYHIATQGIFWSYVPAGVIAVIILGILKLALGPAYVYTLELTHRGFDLRLSEKKSVGFEWSEIECFRLNLSGRYGSSRVAWVLKNPPPRNLRWGRLAYDGCFPANFGYFTATEFLDFLETTRKQILIPQAGTDK